MSIISVSLFRKLETVEPSLREVLIAILEEIEKQQKERVTKEEFGKLGKIIEDLAEAQKRTEQRVEELSEAQKKTEQRVRELAEAQKRTEQRVEELAEAQKRSEQKIEELSEAQKKTEQRVEELAVAQKRTEQRIEELAVAQKKTEQKVEELAVAQKKTEQKVEELAVAQKRTEQRVEELAIAQERTEKEIQKLAEKMKEFEDRLEGISHSVGFSLENRAYRALPKILTERYGVVVKGRLLRKYIPLGRKNIQVNIFGYGSKNGEEVVIIGECKVRPSKKEINRFVKYARKIAETEQKKPFLLFVAHDFPPDIENFLQSNDIPFVWSYEFE